MSIIDVLITRGFLNKASMERATQLQKTWRSPLGSILLAIRAITPMDLARALAEQANTEVVSLENMQKLLNKKVLFRYASMVGEELLRHQYMLPLCEDDSMLTVAAIDPTNREPLLLLEKLSGKRIHVVVATDRDLRGMFIQCFRSQYNFESTLGWFQRSPKESAVTTFTRAQLIALAGLFTVAMLFVWWSPSEFFQVVLDLISLFYFVAIAFKLAASLLGTQYKEMRLQQAPEQVIADEDLPIYTVLIPMYKEPEVTLRLLIDSLLALDYPTSKLDVKFLLEADDLDSLTRLQAIRPPGNFEIIRVPPSVPRTKPKACNFGLLFAKGEFLTIYDAEDMPEPAQLRRALAVFRAGPPNLLCVQAALNYFNADQNFLTRMFTLEYSYWFDYMLPGIDAMRLPIPLGGTSNHFRTEDLRKLGGWDPFNVTEDADLGVRASFHNYIVYTLDSTTYEEANSQVWNWIRQRSRWIKGYMQTWLVHMRNPLETWQKLGPRAFFGFQLLIGATPLLFLLNPIMWIVFILQIFFNVGFMEQGVPPWEWALTQTCFLAGNFFAIYLNMLAVFRRKLYWLTPYAMLNPVYWALHSVAAYIGLWQLLVKPFHWEKTNHGLHERPDERGAGWLRFWPSQWG